MHMEQGGTINLPVMTICMLELHIMMTKYRGSLYLIIKLIFFPKCGYFGVLSICCLFLQSYVSDPSVFITSRISTLKIPIKIKHKFIQYVFFITNYTTKLHPALTLWSYYWIHLGKNPATTGGKLYVGIAFIISCICLSALLSWFSTF